ncbi:MAG: hypothetical protein IPL84_17120 [Chitinophagaceae bacterium]|nr:hypothetical protein [Chitinophagaceae bacterium]
MKKFITILFIAFAANGFCQKAILIDKYVLPEETIKEGQLIIDMPFGYSNILKITGDTAGLKTAGDIYIDVVCTDYPANASLQVLNNSRVASFLKQFPFVAESQLAQVNFFQQTDGALRERAITMFHGLVVKFRPKQSIESAVKEIPKLDYILKPVSPEKLVTVPVSAMTYDSAVAEIEKLYKNRARKYEKGSWYVLLGRAGVIATELDTQKKTKLDSFVTMSPKEALKAELISKSEYKDFKWTSLITLYYPRWFKLDAVPIPKAKEVTTSVKVPAVYKVPDSTIIKIFTRTKWKKPTVVGDVTGSMYPYIAQLLLWVKINAIDSLSRKYVFFNDGDNLPENKKKLGATGGIYYKTCNSFEEVQKLVKFTMAKGGGGDCPENDIEALLKGEKAFPENDYQVLIADNWAPIKDKAIWQYLKKPVRVVLCGATSYNVNIDYLNLARQTGGSVHLIESDLYNLNTLREGEILKIGKNSFMVKNGLFVELGQIYNK